MVFTKRAAVRLLEWASQKAKPVQRDFLDYLNRGIKEEEKFGISVMTGQLIETFIRDYEYQKKYPERSPIINQ